MRPLTHLERQERRERQRGRLSAVSTVIEHDGDVWTLYGDGRVVVRKMSRWARVVRSMRRRSVR